MRIALIIAAKPKNLRLQKGPVVPIGSGKWRVSTSNGCLMHLWIIRDNPLPTSAINIYDSYEFTLEEDSRVQLEVREANGVQTNHLQDNQIYFEWCPFHWGFDYSDLLCSSFTRGNHCRGTLNIHSDILQRTNYCSFPLFTLSLL